MPVYDLPYPFDGQANLPPFSVARVNDYRTSGWKRVIPLPYGKQDPPPAGYTGRAGQPTKTEQLKTWIAEAKRTKQGTANIAIVHTPLTISIDVDHYGYADKKTGETKEKLGGDSLRALEEELGALPPTWRSTARGIENPSGQRFFRLKPEHSPELLDYDDKPGPSIEIVRFGHRYSVVWPSMNGRLGEVYRWITPDGVFSEKVPQVEELPFLPDAWVDYLTRGFTGYRDVPRIGLDDQETLEWVSERPDTDGEPCARMRQVLARALEEMSGGAHDTARDRLMEMMLLAHEGHAGLNTASHKLRDSFFEEVQGRRSAGAMKAEWYREYVGAVARAAAREDAPAAACVCWEGLADGFGGEGAAKDPASYEQNDGGNAEHLLDLVNGDMIWCKGYQTWMLWVDEGAVWTPDVSNGALARARQVEPRLKASAGKFFDAAQKTEDEDAKSALNRAGRELKEWARQAGNRVRLTNMLEVAKAFDGITVPMEQFDANPSILVCKGGTIELLGRGSEEGVRFRESERRDYSMNSTGIEYVPWDQIRKGGEGSGLLAGRMAWEDYLNTFIPDTELRWFVQRLLGYALYGANPERKIVFFQGPTSTGKSTILEAASAAIGRYAASFNLSMFRENQNEGPRPDIVEALTKRMIVATEGDNEWHLHADTIKRATGGVDKMKARNLHSNDILERAPAFVPFIGTNSSPTIQGADSALWQRLIAVPFDVQRLGKQQKKSAAIALQKGEAERRAVLSWLIDGYVGYARQGIDDLPAAVDERGKAFRAGVSDWHSYMQDAIEYHPGARIAVKDLYQEYRIWGLSLDLNEKQMSNFQQFKPKLVSNGFTIAKRKKPGTQTKIDYILDYRMRVDEVEEDNGSDKEFDKIVGNWTPPGL